MASTGWTWDSCAQRDPSPHSYTSGLILRSQSPLICPTLTPFWFLLLLRRENSWEAQNIFQVSWTSEVVQTMALVSWASNSVKSGKISVKMIMFERWWTFTGCWRRSMIDQCFIIKNAAFSQCSLCKSTLFLGFLKLAPYFFSSATTCCIPRRTKKTKFYCMP